MWIFRSSHKHIAQDTLSEYLDGRLSGRPLERVEQRLADCDACRQELEGLQALVAMMQQLPMAEPRRSFVMSVPPPEPARARPNLAQRTPNWVYACAASVAALALAVTISVDATGGLTSDPLRQDSVAITAAAPVAESAAEPEQATGAFGARSGPGPAGQSGGIEFAAPSSDSSGGATGDTSVASQEAAAPPSLADAVAPPSEQPAQEEPAGGQLKTYEYSILAEATPVPLGTSAPVVKMTAASPDEEANAAKSVHESAEAPVAVPAPEAATAGEDGEARGPASETDLVGPTAVVGPARTSPEPFEPAVPDLFTDTKGGGTSTWWRLLEVVAGAFAVLSVAVLAFRWRSGRRDLP
jgi:hypothetical protein